MKKYFNTLVAVAMTLLLSLSLAACGDDNGNDDPEPPVEGKTVKKASVCVSFYANQAVLDTYDIVGKSNLGEELSFSNTPVDITFSDGETIPMYAMKLEASGANVPFSAEMNLKFTLKDGYEVPEKSDFAVAETASGTISFTDNTFDLLAAQDYKLHSKGIPASKINDYTDRLNSRFGSIKATLTRTSIKFDDSADQ